MAYRMIVLDLDGTLTNRDKVITPRTKEALMKLKSQGGNHRAGLRTAYLWCDAAGEGAGTHRGGRLYPVLQRRADYRMQNG